MALSTDAAIPDSKLARAVTEFIRDSETELLFNHSSRVYHFGALAGVHRGVKFDRALPKPKVAGVDAKGGYGNVPFHRTEFTAIVVAHRLRTVQRADSILILERGRVVESGSREALSRDPASRFAGLLQAGLDVVPEEVLI